MGREVVAEEAFFQLATADPPRDFSRREGLGKSDLFENESLWPRMNEKFSILGKQMIIPNLAPDWIRVLNSKFLP